MNLLRVPVIDATRVYPLVVRIKTDRPKLFIHSQHILLVMMDQNFEECIRLHNPMRLQWVTEYCAQFQQRTQFSIWPPQECSTSGCGGGGWWGLGCTTFWDAGCATQRIDTKTKLHQILVHNYFKNKILPAKIWKITQINEHFNNSRTREKI